MTKVVKYYRLVPVYEDEVSNEMANSAFAVCLATAEMLDGRGGGGEYLSKEIVDALRAGKSETVRFLCRHKSLIERFEFGVGTGR